MRTEKLILGSASPFRRQLMENAGLTFDVQAARIDERAVEAALEPDAKDPANIALQLARAKALSISAQTPDAFVIGSDQTMSMDGEIFHKCQSEEEAATQILSMAGRTHELNSAVVISRDQDVVWEHVSVAHMTFRHFDAGFVETYLKLAGKPVLQSVGAYQLEGVGIQLFDKIDGDYFTVLGLPMLPLLDALRKLGIIVS